MKSVKPGLSSGFFAAFIFVLVQTLCPLSYAEPNKPQVSSTYSQSPTSDNESTTGLGLHGTATYALAENECGLSLNGCFGLWANSPAMQALSAVPYYFSAAGVVPSPYIAAGSPPGAAAGPIDVWNRCRYVDNITPSNAPQSAFIPFNSQAEWDAFIQNAPGNIFNLVHCARPDSFIILPDQNCASPSPASYTINLPYGRTGTTLPASVSFQCTQPPSCSASDPTLCGNPTPWTETATLVFYALDSDVVNPPGKYWSQNAGYSPAPPSSPPPDILCPAAVSMLNALNQPVPTLPQTAPIDVAQNSSLTNQGAFLEVNGNNLSEVLLNETNSYVVINGNNNQIILSDTHGVVIVTGDGNSVSLTGNGTPIVLDGTNNSLLLSGSNIAVCSNGDNNSIASSGNGTAIDSSGDNNANLSLGDGSIIVSVGDNNANAGIGENTNINSTGNNTGNFGSGNNVSITSSGNNNGNAGFGAQVQINAQGNNNASTGSGGQIQINSQGNNNSNFSNGPLVQIIANGP